ncbi:MULTISPECIES: signal peptidase I [Suilimivivens]|uniref:Signal peptidase I n=1 Tax=Suilimivivens aceti TaxID=2981774 RepID=A0ABT2SZ51_9FIRM|nr:signal peptidase I [Suilimivivens aceti]MCU6743275.1 signal peptidase I [Suilimivivens aceti]SCH13197.1 Signal peptidase I P [uncultured Clostridium sp.]
MARKKGLTFYEKEKKINKSTIHEILSTLFYCGVAVFLAFVLVFSVGMKISMVGVSMEPALYNGQEVLINRFIYKITSPKRGDVIAFLPNGNQNSHYYLKRIVGLPGESIQIIDGYVYINGERLPEDEYDKMADYGIAGNEIQLGSDEYFVLGDNRNMSEDSRSGNIGAVKKDTIAGKVWFHLSCDEEGTGFVN